MCSRAFCLPEKLDDMRPPAGGPFSCSLFLQKILQHSFRVVEELLCDHIMLGVFVIGTLYALIAQLVYLRPGVRHKYWRMGTDDEL